MSAFRICPTNKLLIEWQLSSGRWGFWMITDSPKEAKRILAVLNACPVRSDAKDNAGQLDLLKTEPT
jgi:hypothetical protein